jgi:hypothetical protein
MFSNKKENILVSPDSKKRDDVLSSLSLLGKEEELIKNNIEILKKEALEYNEVGDKLDVAEKVLKEILDTIVVKEIVLKSLLDAEKKLKEVKIVFDNLLIDNKKLEENNKNLSEEILKKNSDLSRISDKYSKSILELKSEADGLLNKIILSKSELTSCEKNLEDVKKISNIEIGKNNILILDLKEEIKTLSLEYKKIENDILSLNSKKANIEDNNNNLILEGEKYLLDKKREGNLYYESKINDIADREGKLSDKEIWLLEKEKSLIDLKTKMESFIGKKIPNINF